jgi:hypothetical protein
MPKGTWPDGLRLIMCLSAFRGGGTKQSSLIDLLPYLVVIARNSLSRFYGKAISFN